MKSCKGYLELMLLYKNRNNEEKRSKLAKLFGKTYAFFQLTEGLSSDELKNFEKLSKKTDEKIKEELEPLRETQPEEYEKSYNLIGLLRGLNEIKRLTGQERTTDHIDGYRTTVARFAEKYDEQLTNLQTKIEHNLDELKIAELCYQSSLFRSLRRHRDMSEDDFVKKCNDPTITAKWVFDVETLALPRDPDKTSFHPLTPEEINKCAAVFRVRPQIFQLN